MVDLLNIGFGNIVPPGAIVNNASFTTAAVDTLECDNALVIWTLGATDIKMVALKLTECDTSGGTYTDCTSLDFSSPDHLPVATDDNFMFGMYLDLRGGHKRYLKLVATSGNGSAGTYGSAIVLLGRAHSMAQTATGKGLAYLLTSAV